MQSERAKHGISGCQSVGELGQFKEPSSSPTPRVDHSRILFALHVATGRSKSSNTTCDASDIPTSYKPHHGDRFRWFAKPFLPVSLNPRSQPK